MGNKKVNYMKILKCIAFSMLSLTTGSVLANELATPSNDLQLSIERKSVGKEFVYGFYFKNSSNMDIYRLSYGTDCQKLEIPREAIDEKVIVSTFSNDFTIENLDSDEGSSPEVGIQLSSPSSNPVALPKVETKIFEIRSNTNIDSEIFNKTFCALGEGKYLSGIGRNKVFADVDRSIKTDVVLNLCKSKYDTLYNGKNYNSVSSSLCSYKQIEIENVIGKAISTCSEIATLENRLAAAEQQPDILALIKALVNDPQSKKLKDELAVTIEKSTLAVRLELSAARKKQIDIEAEFKSLKEILQRSCEGKDSKVLVDIKPGRCEDPVGKRNNNTIRVAVLGSISFDATKTDLKSWTLNGTPAASAVVEDIGASYDCTNRRDGFKDVLLTFSTDKVSALSGGNYDENTTYRLLITGRPLKGSGGDSFFGAGNLTLIKK